MSHPDRRRQPRDPLDELIGVLYRARVGEPVTWAALAAPERRAIMDHPERLLDQ